MRAYSDDLRRRVLAALDGGATADAAAVRFAVSVSWVRRLRQRRRETGETAPRPAGRRPRLLATHAAAIRAAVAATPDATLAELKTRLGLTASPATLWRAVAGLGLTRKNSRPGRPSRTART